MTPINLPFIFSPYFSLGLGLSRVEFDKNSPKYPFLWRASIGTILASSFDFEFRYSNYRAFSYTDSVTRKSNHLKLTQYELLAGYRF